MNINGVLGIFKIDERGLCSQYCEFAEAKKQFDPQLIAGFFYAMSNFTGDYFGEGVHTLKTDNYKILFQKDSESLNVYIVENSFKDYEMLNSEIPYEYKYILNGPPNNE